MMTADTRWRIFANRELVDINFEGKNDLPNFGVKAEDQETVFFLKEDNYRYVFCRAKLPQDMGEKDFFAINKEDFEQMCEEGRVNMF